MKSIQRRLTLWLLATVVVLFGLTWLVIIRFPEDFTVEYIATQLEHDAEALVLGISFDAQGEAVLDPDFVAPVYMRPASGHYFQLQSGEYNLRSRSLGSDALDIRIEEQPQKTLLRTRGPGDQPLLVWVVHYLKDGHTFSLAIAEELTALRAQINRFRLQFSLVTLLLVLLMFYAQRTLVKLSLAPLENIRKACRQLETGEIRRLPADVPLEVRPLVDEINRLVELMQQRLLRSRNSMGNLAHALKTPLAVLRQYIEQKAPRLDSEWLEQTRASLAMIQSIIDRELKRARVAGPASGGEICHLHREIPDVIGLLQKVFAGKRLVFEQHVEGDVSFGDREDMLELLGNLLENAGKWCRHRVRVSAACKGGLALSVEDDGPGIEASVQETLLQRGIRLDESTSGYGLGLSIVKDIVDQYGGTLEFSRSPSLGGLVVKVFLPG